jgi:chromosome segregation ATPase
VNTSFAPIGRDHSEIAGENSFWPSFTDIMMVITMIFLMATSLLVVRNWQLVAELRESVASEQLAAQLIETTSLENATLEERLANAEQSNSILRLRALKKEEELALAQSALRDQEIDDARIQAENLELKHLLEQTQTQLASANLEIDAAIAQYRELASQISNLNQELAQQKLETEQTSARLQTAQTKIATLSESSDIQQKSISQLTLEKSLLQQDIAAYNQQLLTLKGDYETVKSKYEELIKPARSATGKFIAEVYYVKDETGKVISYKEPGDSGFTRLSLAEVEQRLDKLKQQYGNDLYIKIIIPEDSGLTYTEAWDFMRNLLVKYDYYYQE